MAEEKLNLYQKLAKIRKQVEVIQRNKEGYGYMYVSEDEILAKVSVGMEQYGLILVPNITPGTTSVEEMRYEKSKWTKDGKPYTEHNLEHVVTADMTYTWIDTDNPDIRYDVNWSMVGQQPDASQAFGSGLSYAGRYFLLKFFNVATPNDDPEGFRKRQKEAEEAESKRVAEAMVNQLDSMVKAVIGAGAPAGKIKEFFIKNGVKDGNYFKMKDPDEIGRVLAQFNEQFSDNGGKS